MQNVFHFDTYFKVHGSPTIDVEHVQSPAQSITSDDTLALASSKHLNRALTSLFCVQI